MKRDVLSIISVAIVIFSGGATGEVTTAAAQPAPVPQTISVPVYFLDAAGELAPVESIPHDLKIQLGAMPGRFGGRGDVPLLALRVSQARDFQLDLADLSAKLAAQAAPSLEGNDAPLKLSPDDVRFARISTWALSGADPLRGFATLFWDLDANGALGPVYFDRPCRLRASISVGGLTIDIPSAGIVWTLSTKDKDSHYLFTRALNPHPAFVIAPPEALEKISSSTLLGRGL